MGAKMKPRDSMEATALMLAPLYLSMMMSKESLNALTSAMRVVMS
eukprot:CAMPEP_0182878568 /NCGR_PEP_ID=MMETSP0034_2-20130328/15434_1 /TAXON_ID=156128 /ORGANISM="Nephroselmis pyriformis, Strain CCMP717" /LENGTH=44 /DNA_ID= /DNA_START= /DNA_END= /DNA_ORIENTATION=